MKDSSPILQTVVRIAVPIAFIGSIVIFFQGHNLPGGGFIAGVLAAAAGAMHMLAFGGKSLAHISWWRVAVLGLLIAIGYGTTTLLLGHGFMNHTVWNFGSFHFPTATIFDLGVYLVVVGTLLTIFNELAQETS